MLFMAIQVSLPKISSILKNRPKSDLCPFYTKPFNYAEVMSMVKFSSYRYLVAFLLSPLMEGREKTKTMTEGSVSVCLVLATALPLVFFLILSCMSPPLS